MTAIGNMEEVPELWVTRLIGQAIHYLKKLPMAGMFSATPFGHGFDHVGSGSPNLFRSLQQVMLR